MHVIGEITELISRGFRIMTSNSFALRKCLSKLTFFDIRNNKLYCSYQNNKNCTVLGFLSLS